MYPKNDYRYYLSHSDDNGDYIMHYGVIGMKWGVHKAKQYDRDYALYTRNNRRKALQRQAQSARNAGHNMSSSEHAKKYDKIESDYKKELQDIKSRYNDIKRSDKNKKASDIYKKSKARNYSEIHNYETLDKGRSIMKGLLGANVVGHAALSKSASESVKSLGFDASPNMSAMIQAASIALRNGIIYGIGNEIAKNRILR